MQRTQKPESTSCRKHSMEISKLPSWICTKSTNHERVVCGFNCCRSSLESSKGHNTGQLTCISCKNPCAWDSRACLGQMHLLDEDLLEEIRLQKSHWKLFKFTSHFWPKYESEGQCKNLYLLCTTFTEISSVSYKVIIHRACWHNTNTKGMRDPLALAPGFLHLQLNKNIQQFKN